MTDVISQTLGCNLWIPYVGAGISLGSGIPLAGAVVGHLCQKVGESFSGNNIDRASILRDHGFLAGRKDIPPFSLRMETTLEQCERVSNATTSLLSAERNLFASWWEKDPNSLHDFLAERLASSELPVVVTTNIDCLIENALRKEVPKKWEKLRILVGKEEFDYEEWQKDKYPLLIKLHGSAFDRVGKSTPETIQMSLGALGRHDALKAKKRVLERLSAKHSFGFFGYSGWDDFDLLPVLRELKHQTSHPWVWLDHLPEGRERPDLDPNDARDRVQSILGDAVIASPDGSHSKAGGDEPPLWITRGATSYRLFGVTSKMLTEGNVGGGSAGTSLADDAIEAWLKDIGEQGVQTLVIHLFEASGNRDALTSLLGDDGVLAKHREEEHLFEEYLRWLKDQAARGDAGEKKKKLTAARKMAQVIDENSDLSGSDRARSLSQLAFAWRDCGEQLEALRAFNKGSKAAGDDEITRFQIEREKLFSYRDLSELSPSMLGESAGIVNELGLDPSMDFGEHAMDSAKKLIKQSATEYEAAVDDSPEKKNWCFQLVKVLLDGAWLCKNAGNVRKGLDLLKRAEEYLESLQDVELRPRVWKDRAWFHWDLGEIDEALEASCRGQRYHIGLVNDFEAAQFRRDQGMFRCFVGQFKQGYSDLCASRTQFEAIRRKGELPQDFNLQIVHLHRSFGEVLVHVVGSIEEGIGEWLDGFELAKEHRFEATINELSTWIREARRRFAAAIRHCPELKERIANLLGE